MSFNILFQAGWSGIELLTIRIRNSHFWLQMSYLQPFHIIAKIITQLKQKYCLLDTTY